MGRYQTGQMNKQMAEGRGRARGTPMAPLPPQARSQPQMDVRGIRSGWDHPWMRGEGNLALPKPLAQQQWGQDTSQRGWQGHREALQLCGARFSHRSKGDVQKDLLLDSQPVYRCSHWVGATRSRGYGCSLQSTQVGFSSSFILRSGTGAPSLASLLQSQSFSCARLSSVMPWAASSARTLSR